MLQIQHVRLLRRWPTLTHLAFGMADDYFYYRGQEAVDLAAAEFEAALAALPNLTSLTLKPGDSVSARRLNLPMATRLTIGWTNNAVRFKALKATILHLTAVRACDAPEVIEDIVKCRQLVELRLHDASDEDGCHKFPESNATQYDRDRHDQRVERALAVEVTTAKESHGALWPDLQVFQPPFELPSGWCRLGAKAVWRLLRDVDVTFASDPMAFELAEWLGNSPLLESASIWLRVNQMPDLSAERFAAKTTLRHLRTLRTNVACSLFANLEMPALEHVHLRSPMADGDFKAMHEAPRRTKCTAQLRALCNVSAPDQWRELHLSGYFDWSTAEVPMLPNLTRLHEVRQASLSAADVIRVLDKAPKIARLHLSLWHAVMHPDMQRNERSLQPLFDWWGASQSTNLTDVRLRDPGMTAKQFAAIVRALPKLRTFRVDFQNTLFQTAKEVHNVGDLRTRFGAQFATSRMRWQWSSALH
jgi:hypothetical protein